MIEDAEKLSISNQTAKACSCRYIRTYRFASEFGL